jgi:hypothetical protein
MLWLEKQSDKIPNKNKKHSKAAFQKLFLEINLNRGKFLEVPFSYADVLRVEGG